MPQVDPDDDGIRRFVVRRYAFDPDRHERRHVVLAAFDNAAEFEAAIDTAAADLRRRRDSGDEIDPHEHLSGVVLEAGHRRRQGEARVVRRAVERGVRLDSGIWQRLVDDLPPGISVLREDTGQD